VVGEGWYCGQWRVVLWSVKGIVVVEGCYCGQWRVVLWPVEGGIVVGGGLLIFLPLNQI